MSQKILYVINHMDWFWSHRLPLAQGAKAQGYDVYVAAAGAGGDKELQRAGFTGLELPRGNIFKIMTALHRHITRNRPDIVHAITLKYAFISGLVAQRHKNLCLVHTLAGLGYLFSGDGLRPKILRAFTGPFLKLALNRQNTKIIFQNPDDMTLLTGRGFVRPEDCHLIRSSGVDIKEFPCRPEPEADEPLVLMPTRLIREKGIAVFVEAARILRKSGSPARFEIAGGLSSSNPNAITRAEMLAMTADGAVKWLGKVEDMPELLARTTLIAYPSYYREGVPKVLLEAAATGRAIVTTDHPGCREAVNHGENGLLVPVKDAVALADAIEVLLDSPAERKKMGQAGRKIAEEQFDVRKIVKETVKVYSRIYE